MPNASWLLVLTLYCSWSLSRANERPNIILFLTSEQDVVLGGSSNLSLPKLMENLHTNGGIDFVNSFTVTPSSCPARSSLYSGQYLQNHYVVNDSKSGNCWGDRWKDKNEHTTINSRLRDAGYKTYFLGEYLTGYGSNRDDYKNIPPGWDYWMGLLDATQYNNIKVSDNGRFRQFNGTYVTDFLADLAAEQLQTHFVYHSDEPLFMVIAPPTARNAQPSKKYAGLLKGYLAPRTFTWDQPVKNKHWIMTQIQNPMPQSSIDYLDNVFRNRLEALRSVDDMVDNIYRMVKKLKRLDNTYIFYTSDTGYHLGQYSKPAGNRQNYETDIRVPLYVLGGSLNKFRQEKAISLNIDILPTLVEMAHQKIPTDVDGRSLLTIIKGGKEEKWRSDLLYSHVGQGVYGRVPGCDQPVKGLAECKPNCVCNDAHNNTFSCIRNFNTESSDWSYCEFQDSESFIEMYDLQKDPLQKNNVAQTYNPAVIKNFHTRLSALIGCSGDKCRSSY